MLCRFYLLSIICFRRHHIILSRPDSADFIELGSHGRITMSELLDGEVVLNNFSGSNKFLVAGFK